MWTLKGITNLGRETEFTWGQTKSETCIRNPFSSSNLVVQKTYLVWDTNWNFVHFFPAWQYSLMTLNISLYYDPHWGGWCGMWTLDSKRCRFEYQHLLVGEFAKSATSVSFPVVGRGVTPPWQSGCDGASTVTELQQALLENLYFVLFFLSQWTYLLSTSNTNPFVIRWL